MSVFTYTATDELAPGTTPGAVTREFRLNSRKRSRKFVGKKSTALSGVVESIKYRAELSYSCQSALMVPESLEEARYEEMFASVENSEPFTFDRYGTIAVPDDPVQCIMVSVSFPQSEQGKKYHRYGFVIREA